MTNRERIGAVLRQEDVDRFPVWLKMANRTWQASQPEPYRSLGAAELLEACGCDVMVGCGMPGDALTAVRPHVSVRREKDRKLAREIIETPDGVLVSENTFDPFTESWHPTAFPGAGTADFRALRWLFTDTEYRVDAVKAEPGHARRRELEARDAFTTTGVGPGPLMHLVEHLCGPENTVYHMADMPETFRELLDLMHGDRVRFLQAVLPHCPADTFWLTENTSTTLISPAMFRDFCMPHLEAYGNLIREHGIAPVHHMCGTLHALLEMIDTLPAVANEAYTTRPLGDVSLAEGRARMPSKALIGGTNATLWLEDPETIARTVAADLAACPNRKGIFLTSAGVLPPPVSFEKAREVTARLKAL